ncbi:MAG: DUF86 domain-containing protein [Bacteroidetes bacterium]|nr:DUF86 domain-containing protein [Bacteroidota bacterium]
MVDEIKTYLFDIIKAINEIESFFDNKPKRFDEFIADTKTKRAVERNLEIIGEAINRIIKIDNSISINNSRKIIDTRNRIAHGYDTVSDDIIWGIVINHLPKLKEEVSSLLND